MCSFQRLPQKVVNEIFDNLSFSEIAKLRSVNKWFNKECTLILNAAFLSLKSSINSLIPVIRKEAEHLNINRFSNYSNEEIGQISCACTFYKTYLILKSELNVLYAVCGRYVQLGLYCFSGGKILDCFKKAIDLPFDFKCEQQRSQQKQASITIRLFVLDEEFLDHFEETIEPLIMKRYSITLCYGTKIMDMLDCYICSNYHLEASYNGNTCQLCGRYEILDTHSVSPPLKIRNTITTASDLKNIMHYFRNEVRWNNYLYAFECAYALCSSNTRSNRKRRKFCLNTIEEAELDNQRICTNETSGTVFNKTFSRRIGNPSEKENVSYFIELECSKYCAPMRLVPFILEATLEQERRLKVPENRSFSEIVRHIATYFEFSVGAKIILSSQDENSRKASTENSLNLYTDGDLCIVFQNRRDIPCNAASHRHVPGQAWLSNPADMLELQADDSY